MNRLLFPVVLCLSISGGIAAMLVAPRLNRNVLVLSLYIEPANGTVLGVNGPHRYFPVVRPAHDAVLANEVAIAEKSPSEFNDLDSLAERLGELSCADDLLLFVSACASIDHGRVTLVTNSQTDGTEIAFLKDLIRVLGQARCGKIAVILDIQWPLHRHDFESTSTNSAVHQAISKELESNPYRKIAYILTSGPQSHARGMQHPRSSSFFHFWQISKSIAATDINANGQLELSELFACTKQEVNKWSTQVFGVAQDPVWIGDKIDFNVAIANKHSSSAKHSDLNPVADYPDWLATAWRKRDEYLSRTDLPVDAEMLNDWQQRLLYAESLWRRGINDDACKVMVESINSEIHAKLKSKLERVAQLRPESLAAAANVICCDATVLENTRNIAHKLRKQLHELNLHANDPETIKAIDKLVVATIAATPADQHLAVLDEIVALICNQNTSTPYLKLAALTLIRNLQLERAYAECIAIDQLAGELDGDYARLLSPMADNLLSIVRLRCRLGSRSLIFAVMAPRLNILLQECLTGEQFFWLNGYTVDAEQFARVGAAASRTEIGVTQQICVEQAINHLEQAMTILTCSSIEHDFQNYAKQILDKAEQLTIALYPPQDKKAASSLTFAAQRFEAIRFADQQLRTALEEFANGVEAMAPDPSIDPLPVFIPAENRKRIYGTLVQQSPLRQQYNTTTDSPDKHHRHADPVETQIDRIRTIERKIWAADQIGQLRRNAWLHRLYATAARTNDSDNYYQSLANQVEGTDASYTERLTRVEWLSSSFDWNHREAQLRIHNSDPNLKVKRKFYILEPSSSCLSIEPSSGVIQDSNPVHLKLSLKHAPCKNDRPLCGFWLVEEISGRLACSPISFPPVPANQPIELYIPVASTDSDGDLNWRLWPKRSTQNFDWFLTNHADQPRSVVVTAAISNGDVLESQPIELTPGQAAAIRFTTSKSAVEQQPPTERLQNLQQDVIDVQVNDAKTKELLLHRKVEIVLTDITKCLDVTSAQFSIQNNGGNNSLAVCVRATKAADLNGHNVQLDLTTESVARYLNVGSGNSSAFLKGPDHSSTIQLFDIAIDEGDLQTAAVALSIDGDREAYKLTAAFPYNDREISWCHDTQPQGLLDAPRSIIPGSPLLIRAGGINLTAETQLVVEYGQYVSGEFIRHFSCDLASPRESVIKVSPAGNRATFAVDAFRDRWHVSIPTDEITGQYTVRLRSVSDSFPVVETNVLLDNQLPKIVAATAPSHDLSAITLDFIPSASGIQSVAVLAPDKSRIPAKRLSADDNEWLVRIPSPLKTLTIVVNTGAGKEGQFDVPIQPIAPITTGKIAGTVIEGTIPQPGIVVAITDSSGRKSEVRTDQYGRFEMIIPAGNTSLVTQKKSTNRSASSQIQVAAGQTSQVELSLLRQLPQT